MKSEDILKELDWEKCLSFEYPYLEGSNSLTHGYILIEDGEKFVISYYHLSGGYAKRASGFITKEDAKLWCWNHYNEKMKPYLKL